MRCDSVAGGVMYYSEGSKDRAQSGGRMTIKTPAAAGVTDSCDV